MAAIRASEDAPYRKLYGSTSTDRRTEAGIFTRASQARRKAEGPRPGRRGPGSACAAARAPAPAARRRGRRPPAARRWAWPRPDRRTPSRPPRPFSPDRITAASRPNGGRPAASRSAISAATKASRSWACERLQHRVLGRPGLQQGPARPVRAGPPGPWPGPAAGRCARPRAGRRPAGPGPRPPRPPGSGCGKLWPLAAAWVATRMSISPVGHGLDQGRARLARVEHGVGARTPPMRASGNRPRASSSTRSTPGPIGDQAVLRPAVRAGLGLRHGEAGQVADQPPGVAVLHQPAVGVRRGHAARRRPGTAPAAHSPGGSGTAASARPAPRSRPWPRPAAATASVRARAGSARRSIRSMSGSTRRPVPRRQPAASGSGPASALRRVSSDGVAEASTTAAPSIRARATARSRA